jgi:hypothetical protein
VTEPVPEPVARVTEPVREPVEQVVPQAPAVQAPVTPSVTDVLEEGGLLGPG